MTKPHCNFSILASIGAGVITMYTYGYFAQRHVSLTAAALSAISVNLFIHIFSDHSSSENGQFVSVIVRGALATGCSWATSQCANFLFQSYHLAVPVGFTFVNVAFAGLFDTY